MRIEIRERGTYYFIVLLHTFSMVWYLYINLINSRVDDHIINAWGSNLSWITHLLVCELCTLKFKSNCTFYWKWGKSNLLERWRDPWSRNVVLVVVLQVKSYLMMIFLEAKSLFILSSSYMGYQTRAITCTWSKFILSTMMHARLYFLYTHSISHFISLFSSH